MDVYILRSARELGEAADVQWLVGLSRLFPFAKGMQKGGYVLTAFFCFRVLLCTEYSVYSVLSSIDSSPVFFEGRDTGERAREAERQRGRLQSGTYLFYSIVLSRTLSYSDSLILKI